MLRKTIKKNRAVEMFSIIPEELITGVPPSQEKRPEAAKGDSKI